MSNPKRLRAPEEFDTWVAQNQELFDAVQMASGSYSRLVRLLPLEMRAIFFAAPIAEQMFSIRRASEIAKFINDTVGMAWDHLATLEGDDPETTEGRPPGEPLH